MGPWAMANYCRAGIKSLRGTSLVLIVQVLMEVLVEEDWIWWNKEKNQVATKSGRTTSVLRKGEAILEDWLRVWHPGDVDPILAKVGGANFPIDGGGAGSINGRN
ncbi:MAG: hypothetical protein ACK56F_27035 [bacterium]